MGEIVPEMDTNTLTQVDRDRYLHSQQVQAMLNNHSPPLPQETKPDKSATLPQQGTAPSLDCSPPRSFSVGSEATAVVREPNEFTCPESERQELERKVAIEKGKSMTMQNILKEELHLGPAKDSSQNKPRKRVATVPARNLKNNVIRK